MAFRSAQEAAKDASQPRWREAGRDVTESVGGTHELHRFVGRWAGGEVGEWAVLRERGSGAVLLDTGGIKTAKLCWRQDGALLVRIDGVGDVRLLIVDPHIHSFRDIGIDETPRPVLELQNAAARAAAELGADGGQPKPRDAYLERSFSPDGAVMVEYAIHPQRMSHETRVPRLVDTETGETLIDMPDSLFDGIVHWRADGSAQLSVRHYVSGHADLYLDLRARTFTQPGNIRPRPFSQAKAELARQVARANEPAKPFEPIREPPAWGSILLTLLIATLAIAAAALTAWYLQESRRAPTPLPPPAAVPNR